MENYFNLFKKAMACMAVVVLTFVSACDDDPSLSNEAELSFFSINEVEFTLDVTSGTAENEDAFVFGTDVTAMIATFSVPEGTSVTVGDVIQESGTTVNDFTNPVVYTITAEDGVTSVDITVTVAVKTTAWEQVATDAFVLLNKPSATVMGDKIYMSGAIVIGGDFATPGDYYEYVYTSENGIDWSVAHSYDPEMMAEQDSVPLGSLSKLVTYKDGLHSIGGLGAPVGDGWVTQPTLGTASSSDGVSWTTTTAGDAGVTAVGVQAMEFNELLYIVGHQSIFFGAAQAISSMDVLQSTDGKTWTSVSEGALSSVKTTSNPPTFYSTFTFGDAMYIAGGVTANWITSNADSYSPSVYKSTDGSTWTVATADGFPKVAGHTVVEYKGKLVAIAGGTGDGTSSLYTSDVYVSEDGVTWTKQTEGLALPEEFTGRAYHNTVVMNDKIYIIGGENIEGGLNDVWVGEFTF